MMLDFLLCIVQYLLIALVLAAVGGFGAFVGIKMRKASDAKKAAQTAEQTEE